MLQCKKIILGISGGIAAYKVPELIRQLLAKCGSTRCSDKNALQFVTPVTLQTLSRNKITSEVFEPVSNFNVEHVSNADWADCMLVAPATANIIGNLPTNSRRALSTAFWRSTNRIYSTCHERQNV